MPESTTASLDRPDISQDRPRLEIAGNCLGNRAARADRYTQDHQIGISDGILRLLMDTVGKTEFHHLGAGIGTAGMARNMAGKVLAPHNMGKG